MPVRPTSSRSPASDCTARCCTSSSPHIKKSDLCSWPNSLLKRDGNVEDWTEIELQNFFIEIVTTVGLPPTFMFIDALDEGDEDDIRQMMAFFEDVGQRALSSLVWLRICF